jgi:23S rRNA pseudouridine1911/1915/1917 synthase
MRFTVDQASAGRRLDAFLAAEGAAASVTAARRAIAAGQVRLDGRRAKKGVRLQAGQVVEASAPDPSAGPGPAPALEVLYQDDDLVAVNKPAGIPSHPLRPGETGSVAQALVARFPECATASADPREGGLGHRLDRGTSGVLLAARHPEAWRRLRQALGAAECEKSYLAEVVGALPVGEAPGSIAVAAAIGRTGRRGSRVRIEGGRRPQPAHTEFFLRERRPDSSLVEARLSKGRAHQVRAHLAHLGCPVVGDAIYGPGPASGDLRLHARAVKLRHPMTGLPLHIEAPLPPWARSSPAPPPAMEPVREDATEPVRENTGPLRENAKQPAREDTEPAREDDEDTEETK